MYVALQGKGVKCSFIVIAIVKILCSLQCRRKIQQQFTMNFGLMTR